MRAQLRKFSHSVPRVQPVTAVCIQIRDILRYSSSSATLNAYGPITSSGDAGRGGPGIGKGSSSTSSDAARAARAGADTSGGKTGSVLSDGENVNLHFSEDGPHDVPEWVLEPASGQVAFSGDLMLSSRIPCARLFRAQETAIAFQCWA